MPRGKTARILALIDACVDILQDIQPASVRAVCYQLFIRKLLASMAKTCTNGVSTQLVYARKQGIVPWEWIVDETRHTERPGTWANPETLLAAAVRSYRRDRWQHQPHRVEVWSEKGTVRGTLGPLLDAYGVSFQVAHGNTSWTKSHDAANDYRDDPRPMTILYVGDCDPSGMYMSEVDLPINRFAWEQVPIAVRRLAILPDAARRLDLPSFPASDKQTDTRYEWFVREYGDTCWELDAMNPNVLRDTVRLAIDEYIDWDAWERCGKVEAAEQRSMTEVLGLWRRVKSGLDGLNLG
jgi:hypothetical protein